jgi:hypothetical protein
VSADTSHLCFTQPSDENSLIWRYMDFTKYVSLLESQALYFARIDLLEDRFEGSITPATLRARNEFLGQAGEVKLKFLTDKIGELRRFTYVNCWHMNMYESLAMWKLYSKSNESVCVQTTYGALRDTLPDYAPIERSPILKRAELPEHDKLFMGLVNYIDSESGVIPIDNLFWPYVHKVRSFEHENEVRVLVQNILTWNNKGTGIAPQNPADGLIVPVDLNKLIKSVRIAPYTDAWYHNLVKNVTIKYGFEYEVIPSILGRDPIY